MTDQRMELGQIPNMIVVVFVKKSREFCKSLKVMGKTANRGRRNSRYSFGQNANCGHAGGESLQRGG